jgi:uncharacterized protein YndB with AHSA1/START domain
MDNRIEKRIELKAPVSRVWRALTDYREFGEWFGVKLDGPFVAGRISRGRITHPGCGQVIWEAAVQKIEHERLFSFTWHPYAAAPKSTTRRNPRHLSNSGWKPLQAAHGFSSPNPALAEFPPAGALKLIG